MSTTMSAIKQGDAMEFEVHGGRLVVTYSMNDDEYKEVSFDFISDKDGKLRQVAVIGTQADEPDVIHSFMYDGNEEDVAGVFYTDKDGEMAYE